MKLHKNGRTVTMEKPGNRPVGIPGNARYAGAGTVFLIIFITINLISNVESYKNDPELYFYIAKIIFLPLLFVVVGWALMLNSGRLPLLKIFIYSSKILIFAYFIEVIFDIFQIYSYPVSRSISVIAAATMLVLAAPLIYLMRRDLKRSRWLDPQSLPHEWEIAAIRDPNSINYRPPKPPLR